MSNEKQTIYIDKKVCLICTRLVGKELGKKTKSCSFKNGNTRCPARVLAIEVGVDTESVLDSFYGALQAGDIPSVISIMTEAQANPKISSALIGDLQDRLFESVLAEEDASDEEDEAAEGADGLAEEIGAEDEDSEDADEAESAASEEDEDEDVEA